MALSKAELAFVIGMDAVVGGSSAVLVDIAGREVYGGGQQIHILIL